MTDDRTPEPGTPGSPTTPTPRGRKRMPDDAYDKAFGGNTEGWASELGELVAYLDAA